MSVICRFRHDAKQFNQHEPGEYTIEASQLARAADPFYGLVWDDAIDQGFIIHSPTKKKDFIFLLERIERDADNDVQVWVFKSYPPSVNDPQMQVTIFND